MKKYRWVFITIFVLIAAVVDKMLGLPIMEMMMEMLIHSFMWACLGAFIGATS